MRYLAHLIIRSSPVLDNATSKKNRRMVPNGMSTGIIKTIKSAFLRNMEGACCILQHPEEIPKFGTYHRF